MNPNYTLKELLDKYSVVIPQLQRDYAQGRDEAKELRVRFLSQILHVLRGEGRLNLDFVYGYDKALSPNHHPIFYPLDGQQRLTTLWLLHWYLLPSKPAAEEREWLLRFSYRTRSSSTRFCQLLVEHAAVDVAAIKDQPWYRQSYNADATIAAMLGTLRTIKELVAPEERVALWERLCHQRALTFDVIDIKGEEFRLTDELYIKMNARGKPLTSFECYKADLTQALRKLDNLGKPWPYKKGQLSYADYFAFKVDNEWLDLFYHGKIDGLDKRMYGFIQNIAKLCFFLDPENAEKNVNAFTYSDSVNVFSRQGNAKRLISILDLFERIQAKQLEKIQAKQPLRAFFATLTPSIRFLEEDGKDASASVKDLFRESCDKNASVKNLVLLLALSHYMETYKLVEATEELQDYLRVLRNLLWEERQLDEMRYRSNVRINSLLTYWSWIESLASREQVLDAIKNSGEVFLKKKEKEKEKKEGKLHQRVDFILKYPELKPLIGELEDHPLLAGQLGIFDLSKDANEFERQAKAFKQIFDPAFYTRKHTSKLIIRALVASRYPGVQGKNVWGGSRGTWFFGGNGYWRTVLSIKEYDQPKQRNAIRQLLSQFAGGTGDTTERLQRIIDAYLESEDAKRRRWRYYFVKYPEFYSGKINFFARDNREETADAYVDSLKSFSSNPLRGYHANAYVQVVWRLVGEGNTHCRPEWVQGVKDSRLHLVRSGIYIGHTPEGWRIDLPQGYVLPEEIMHEFELSPSNLILRTPTADRIERAVAFCRSLLPNLHP
ncbi:MAG: DUF262 domain-containing protein [Porphyromonadaceae bacterium]|nr:DUF262 domain-containing protein [Porphyromonadaceae bacterium]